jgi:hypothetical protein
VATATVRFQCQFCRGKIRLSYEYEPNPAQPWVHVRLTCPHPLCRTTFPRITLQSGADMTTVKAEALPHG